MPAAGTPAARSGATDQRLRLGRRGEQLAALHLERLGFEILARNQRTRHGEIDLIACDGETIVFAEVKTRLASPGGAPAPELAWPATRQRRRLRRLARAWLTATRRSRPFAPNVRFDLVRVLLGDSQRLLALEHLPGVL
jgi:putative endonuclease